MTFPANDSIIDLLGKSQKLGKLLAAKFLREGNTSPDVVEFDHIVLTTKPMIGTSTKEFSCKMSHP